MSEIRVDTINEKTSGSGVTIDGLIIKDGNISGDVSLAGVTPTFTIGDAGAEDATLVFDGNAQDFYIALDDSADDLIIGLGSTVGTTPMLSFTEAKAASFAGAVTMASTLGVTGIVSGAGFTAGSAVLAEAELELLDGLTAGTAIASKVVTTDANIDSTGMRNLTISGEIDAATGDFSGAIDVAGTANLDVVDIDGAVDMATTLALAGNADFNGDLDVDGTTNLDVVDIDGAVDMATTLALAGNADFNGDLDVDGTTNLDVVDIDGAVDIAGALVNHGDVTLTGASTNAVWDASNNSLDFADSTQLRFGAGADLKMYHDASNSYIVDSGTGALKILGSTVQIMNAAGDENILLGTADGAVTIYNNNVALYNTSATENVFNEASNDIDFRVESNGNANAIFVNGGTDSVTIGATGVVQTIAGIPLYRGDGNNTSIYTADVSGTDSTAQFNSAYGIQALDAITTGDYNTVIGYNAGTVTTESNHSVFIGANNALANTTGTDNISIGSAAFAANTTGGNNISIGSAALDAADTESHNMAIGNGALGGAVAGGEYNVAVGNNSLDAVTSGDANVAVGYNAGSAVTTGIENNLFGKSAGADITEGDGNVCIGEGAGATTTSLTTGDSNIYIGYKTRGSAADNSSEIVIGTENSTGKGGSTAFINGGGGNIYNGANTTAWDQTSDRRIKKNIVDNNKGLEAINKIQVRNFEYRTLEEITDFDNPESAVVDKAGIKLGAIAQEIEEILPDLITTETTGVKTLNPSNLTWYLINAVKELSAKVKALENA